MMPHTAARQEIQRSGILPDGEKKQGLALLAAATIFPEHRADPSWLIGATTVEATQQPGNTRVVGPGNVATPINAPNSLEPASDGDVSRLPSWLALGRRETGARGELFPCYQTLAMARPVRKQVQLQTGREGAMRANHLFCPDGANSKRYSVLR